RDAAGVALAGEPDESATGGDRMNSHESASAYHQSAAFGATAVGQIIALYDRILRDLRQALAAVESARIEERVNSTNHALVVIGELQGVLDLERGGEP